MSCTTKRERKYGSKQEIIKTRISKREQSENIKELINKGKYKHAKENIDSYIENYGEDCYILLYCGKYYFKMKDLEEATKYFQKIIDMNGENKYYAYYELSKIQRGLKKYDEAKYSLDQIIESNHPEKCHAKFELAKLYEDMGDEKTTELLLNKLIDDGEPNMYYALFKLADLKLKHNELITTGQLIKRLKGNIDKESLYYIQAKFSVSIGEFEKAITQFNNISSLHTKRFLVKVPHQLALIEFLKEEYEKVIEMETANLKRSAVPYKESITLIADSYIRLRNFDKAIEYIELLKQQSYYTLNDDVAFLVGKLYCMQSKWEKAIEQFDKINPKHTSVYRDSVFRKACIYNKLGDYDNAKKMLDELKRFAGEKYKGTIIKFDTYLKNKNGEITDINENMCYTEKQCVKYDKQKAIEHISLHKSEDSAKKYHSMFHPDIVVEELYNDVLLKLTEENFYDNNFLDCYIVEYPNVGINNNRIINHLKVITLANTKKVITMYPYDNCIEKEKQIVHKKEVKKLSRIDKFNKKYNLG